jgi:hypothetical protein
LKQSFKTKLRQLWFPTDFRLPEPEFSKEQLDLLEELIQLINPTLSRAEQASRDDKLNMANFLIDLGTGIWRIRCKIEGMTRMPKEIRDALYSLESTWMSMSEGGVEIVDHIGSLPNKHEVKVIEVREIPNLAREQVIDTIKPTILFHGEVIQLGEVIVGKPVNSSDSAVHLEVTEDRQDIQTEPEQEIAPTSSVTTTADDPGVAALEKTSDIDVSSPETDRKTDADAESGAEIIKNVSEASEPETDTDDSGAVALEKISDIDVSSPETDQKTEADAESGAEIIKNVSEASEPETDTDDSGAVILEKISDIDVSSPETDQKTDADAESGAEIIKNVSEASEPETDTDDSGAVALEKTSDIDVSSPEAPHRAAPQIYRGFTVQAETRSEAVESAAEAPEPEKTEPDDSGAAPLEEILDIGGPSPETTHKAAPQIYRGFIAPMGAPPKITVNPSYVSKQRAPDPDNAAHAGTDSDKTELIAAQEIKAQDAYDAEEKPPKPRRVVRRPRKTAKKTGAAGDAQKDLGITSENEEA